MTAALAINSSVCCGLAAAVAWALVARTVVKRGLAVPWVLILVGASGAVFGLSAITPAAAAIARKDLSRAPAAALLAIPWAVVGGTALYYSRRTALGIATCILIVGTSCLPTGVIGVAAGGLSGAVRIEKACSGNLHALAKAFRQYVYETKHWPPESRWVEELLPFLPYPRSFRCPAAAARAYDYRRPPSDAPSDTPVIRCPHGFVGKELVLRKDFRVEERALSGPR
ncbi:MAG: hypothetical protein H5T86_02460 [Armatimonadetes bacterium]|nr:hypothetical protein [Armatimonadota bacterium]